MKIRHHADFSYTGCDRYLCTTSIVRGYVACYCFYVVVLSDLKRIYMDEKYNMPVTVLTIAAFAISTFSLGQVIATGGSVSVLSTQAQQLKSMVAESALYEDDVAYVDEGVYDDAEMVYEDSLSYVDAETPDGQDAAVAAGTRRVIQRPTGAHYVCTFPGGGQIITTMPSSVQSFSYNTGAGPTQSFSGAQITAGCVLVNPTTPTTTPAV